MPRDDAPATDPTQAADVQAERAEALADFLRVRRTRIAPETAGFARGRRRRTRGLRREEVAQLAGVSVTWYTWLEQARAIRVSAETLESLARALRLSPAERTHLFLLALGHPPVDAAAPPAEAPDTIHRLLASVGAVPAYAMGPLWELLAWNPAAAAVFGLDSLAPGDRNMLWYILAHPAARERLVHWEGNAQRVMAQFRAATARYVGDPRVTTLVERLLGASREFAEWWPRHDVSGRPGCRKEMRHPAVGRLVFEHNTLLVSDAPDIRVVFYAPLDEEGTIDKVRRLVGGVE
ncbi:MAG TPA: helix-turn-helix transcriptional regulator [Gemmatimonadaceae bacterium]|nr:helix-turn-helix transcriptional regulator [Gemmatimonadaceae bacterium]